MVIDIAAITGPVTASGNEIQLHQTTTPCLCHPIKVHHFEILDQFQGSLTSQIFNEQKITKNQSTVLRHQLVSTNRFDRIENDDNKCRQTTFDHRSCCHRHHHLNDPINHPHRKHDEDESFTTQMLWFHIKVPYHPTRVRLKDEELQLNSDAWHWYRQVAKILPLKICHNDTVVYFRLSAITVLTQCPDYFDFDELLIVISLIEKCIFSLYRDSLFVITIRWRHSDCSVSTATTTDRNNNKNNHNCDRSCRFNSCATRVNIKTIACGSINRNGKQSRCYRSSHWFRCTENDRIESRCYSHNFIGVNKYTTTTTSITQSTNECTTPANKYEKCTESKNNRELFSLPTATAFCERTSNNQKQQQPSSSPSMHRDTCDRRSHDNVDYTNLNRPVWKKELLQSGIEEFLLFLVFIRNIILSPHSQLYQTTLSSPSSLSLYKDDFHSYVVKIKFSQLLARTIDNALRQKPFIKPHRYWCGQSRDNIQRRRRRRQWRQSKSTDRSGVNAKNRRTSQSLSTAQRHRNQSILKQPLSIEMSSSSSSGIGTGSSTTTISATLDCQRLFATVVVVLLTMLPVITCSIHHHGGIRYSTNIIKTKYGPLRGILVRTNPPVEAFLGVPYATPPVGSLR